MIYLLQYLLPTFPEQYILALTPGLPEFTADQGDLYVFIFTNSFLCSAAEVLPNAVLIIAGANNIGCSFE